MAIVNAYMVSPNDIKPDDVMLFVIKAIVMYDGTYRLYQCPYDGPTSKYGLPQGARVSAGYERGIAQAIFPSLALVAEPDLQR